MKIFKWERAFYRDESFLIKVGMNVKDDEFNVDNFKEEEIYDVDYEKFKDEIIEKFNKKEYEIEELDEGEILYVF